MKKSKRTSILLLSVLMAILIFNQAFPKDKGGDWRILLIQSGEKGEKKEEPDPHFIQILKQLKEKVDGWLKSLNERIENEDITRFKVRFLEIIRNILEWVKEKIDSKIKSLEDKKQEKKEGPIRETYRRAKPFYERE
jgi:hypothetical protein